MWTVSNRASLLAARVSRAGSMIGRPSTAVPHFRPVALPVFHRSYEPARGYSAEPEVEASAAEPPVSPKVRALADGIAELTLLEVADLCKVLKVELNIADAAPVAFAAGPAAAPAAAAEAGEDADAGPAGPTSVKLVLTGFKDDSKVKVIKELKSIMSPVDPKFNLAAAKKFVEGCPGVIREDMPKDEAEKLKEALEAAGGEVKFE